MAAADGPSAEALIAGQAGTAEQDRLLQQAEMETEAEEAVVAGVEGSTQQDGPPKIQRLCEHVVNRIAAGEVVQRPCSAVKEMLENSIDAGATQVTLTFKDGGLKMLQIQDNGHGIREDDLPLLCERHATSKLREYDDLQSIGTLGFRGEALASISYISNMTVTTMRLGGAHGLRATYRDSVMDPDGAKPCAAVPGTTICVEHLFYNVPTRRKVLKSATEEYNRILDVVSRYAVFQKGVGITCKRQGEARPDVQTLASGSRKDNIRGVYGAAVARELVSLELRVAPKGPEDPSRVEFTAEGFISSANYVGKKTVFVLFINQRCVECAPLKRMLEAVYVSVLPKTSKPFVFMDIRLPSPHVDVNLHPTKKEVGFVHQEELVELLRAEVEKILLASNSSRSFAQGTLTAHVGLAPPVARLSFQREGAEEESGPAKPDATTRRDQAGGDHKLVRTDAKARSLESFLHRSGKGSGSAARAEGRTETSGARAAAAAAAGHAVARKRARASRGDAVRGAEAGSDPADNRQAVRQRRDATKSLSQLTSVQELMAEAMDEAHEGLSETMGNHMYVGLADGTHALIQHKTGLYLVDIGALSYDLAYQQVLHRFEHFERIVLDPAPSVRELMLIALDVEEAQGRWEESDGPKEKLAELTQTLLIEKAEMLAEYFAMDITPDGAVTSLPEVVRRFPPDLDRLPGLVLALGRDTDWTSEKECFQTIAEALADFYSVKSPVTEEARDTHLLEPSDGDSPGETDGGGQASLHVGKGGAESSQRDWLIQHVLFPELKRQLHPHKKRASDGTVVELARLERLYRIFERC